MANNIGWGQGAINNNIGWGQGASSNSISWGISQKDSYSGETEIYGIRGDVDALAFNSRVVASGGTLTATEQAAINQLVVDLKAYGLWNSMKAIYPMVGASAAACAQNLKSSSFTGTFTSGWTFASTGVTGNGTSAYLNTNFVPNSNLTSNNTHQSLYIRTTGALGIDDFSAFDSVTSVFRVIIKDSGSNRFFAQQTDGVTVIDLPTAVPDSKGFFVITRENINSLKAKRNNINLGTNILANTGTLPTRSMYLGALNISTTAVNFTSRQYSFASLGDGLTDTQAANFYTAVQAFQTTLSRQV
jgi:hypothetical protein